MSFEIIIPFLKPIEHLLESRTISEIMVNPDSTVWIEKDGRIQPLPEIRFDEGALLTGLEVIANRFGKKLDDDSPIMNLRLPDGSRLAATIPPIVHPEPLVTIRKFTSRNFTMNDLIDREMLTGSQAGTLSDAVRRGENILISGGTGTGKTTLLNVLADAIPEEERILIIEDTAELYLRKPHVVAEEAQTDTHRKPVTFDDLLRAALRHRPDRIILGEIRGIEARTLLDAMNTGHRGTLTTIHASSAKGALLRLRTLLLRGTSSLRPAEADAEIHSSIHRIVHIDRNGTRRQVQEILELDPQLRNR
ncbi:MAG TPA: ATPase, T2SS/T4P/T4SS family [Terracidiphilus sp.]|nr:ATPase, T2SS/T4P/T4SS family [Terracidiphilus sp.]HEV2398022.1 ATPase, T2SS/T4P/T4SS family [Candidatus Sulfotelmatobacter sp.]